MPPADIKVLAPAIAEQIAAGEVVLHPAAVVKELIENAIDAGASQISIHLQAGGVESIEVMDDGAGMSKAQLPIALQRHATSKITNLDDFDQLHTYGFRGEALPSIAAVSRLRLESRLAGDDTPQPAGMIEVHGGVLMQHQEVAAPPGTRVVVQDLFYTTPARRKFLKSTAYELARVQKWVTRFALAQPQISFHLYHHQRLLSFYPATPDPAKRLEMVLGKSWVDKHEVVAETLNDEQLTIYFTRPEVSFGNTQQQFYFLNQRAIVDRSLQHAVTDAYRTLVMQRRYPGVVLYLKIPPSRFDVNVHPSKEEVRFVDSSSLHSWVARLLRKSLAGFKLPETASYAPTHVDNLLSSVGQHPVNSTTADYKMPAWNKANDSATTALPLFDVPQAAASFQRLRLLGQLRNCYMVCERQGELLLIDQHAAHERVLFEKISQQLTSSQGLQQELLTPYVVHLNAVQQQTLELQTEALQKLGFIWEPFGEGAVLLRSHPGYLSGDVVLLLLGLLDDLQQHASMLNFADARASMVASMACHSAIRFHQPLEVAEMQALLAELDKVDMATNCPHGRPLYITITDQELQRLFKR